MADISVQAELLATPTGGGTARPLQVAGTGEVGTGDFGVDKTGAGKEATQLQVRDAVLALAPFIDTVESLLQRLPASGAASDAKLDSLITLIGDVRTAVQDIAADDESLTAQLQTTLTDGSLRGRVEIDNDAGSPIPVTGTITGTTDVAVVSSALPDGAATAAKQDAAKAVLDLLNGKDYSTGANQTAIKAVLDQIQANTANLSVDVAELELTADQVNLNTDGIETILTSINGKDFATQATLLAAKAVLDSLNGKDYATQTTLAAAKTTLDNIAAKDFATQTTLAAAKSVLDALNAKDYATAANQATAHTALESINSSTLAVRDRLPAALDADGGVKVHLQNPSTDGATEATLVDIKTAVQDLAAEDDTPNQIVTNTATLAGAGVYTSAWFDVSQYGGVAVQIATDQTGTCFLEHSLDATDPIIDRTGQLPVSGNIGSNGRYERFVAIPFHNRYFRVRYVNGATPQTVFRLQLRLLKEAPPVLQRIELPLSDAGTAQTTRAVIAGKDPSGAYVNERSPGVAPQHSSTAPLLASGVFTGSEWTDVSGYVAVGVLVDSDRNSAAAGCEFQWSNDGSNLARTTPFTYASAPDGRFFQSPIQGRFFRLRYTNTGTDQTFLVLQTIMFDEAPANPILGLESVLDAGLVAVLGRNLIAARNASGVYDNIGRGVLGGLNIEVQPADSWRTRQGTLTTSPTRVDTGPLAGRKEIEFKSFAANGNGIIYIGESPTVSSSTGRPVDSGEPVSLSLSDAVALYAVAGSGTQNYSIAEIR